MLVGIPICAEEDEVTDFGGGSYVLTDASAHVVVANTHQTHLWRSIVGEAKLHGFGQVRLIDHFVGDGQIGCYQVVHALHNFVDLGGGGLSIEQKRDFAFLALDVRIDRPLATEHAHHGLIEQMLTRVRRAVLLLVVLVELRLIHGIYINNDTYSNEE